MTGIDVGLYDYDRHSSIYFFAVSPDEQIYFRYGGRDARSMDSYLDLDSLVLALEAGLRQHELWTQGSLSRTERPTPRFPRDIASLREAEMRGGRCVECHLITDYEVAEKERAGSLDKPRDMFRSPDIRRIGIELDVPKGLVVKRVSGAAEAAGLRAGDLIVELEGASVLTFGDLLHGYDQMDRGSRELFLRAQRSNEEEAVEIRVGLPPLWWVSDLSFRRWSIDPVVHFEAQPLTKREKQELGLRVDGFGCAVTKIDRRARRLRTHSLELDDVIYSINGTESDDVATDCRLYLQLRVRAGDRVELGILRNGRRLTSTLRTQRHRYRQSQPNGNR